MFVRCVRFLVVAAILAGLGIVPSTSSAARLQTERFHATLSASQATTWTLNYDTGCAVQTGSGSRKLSFHQSRKLTLVFSRQVGGTHLLEVRLAGKPDDIAIAGEMTQLGKVVTTNDPRCSVVGRPEGPPMAPPSPDCGTKRFAGSVRATWSPPETYPSLPEETPPLTPVFWIDEPYIPPLFTVCPYYGPLIAFRLTHAGLKESKVFGPKPKLVLRDQVKKVSESSEAGPGVRSETTIGWTMRLTRLG